MTVSFENVKVGDLRRFWCWVEQKESGCCEWVGKRTSDGYGVFKYEGKNRRAHRWLHELLNGAAPDGEIVRHTCDNPPCVNPAHLLAFGVESENNGFNKDDWDTLEILPKPLPAAKGVYLDKDGDVWRIHEDDEPLYYVECDVAHRAYFEAIQYAPFTRLIPEAEVES